MTLLTPLYTITSLTPLLYYDVTNPYTMTSLQQAKDTRAVLNHMPASHIDTNTVFRPVIDKKKTIAIPKVCDVIVEGVVTSS